MTSFFIGFIIALVFCIAIMILSGYVNTLDRVPDDIAVSNPFHITFKFNWRVYKDGWKFHIIPFFRLKYKNCEDRKVKHFDVRFGWLFLFVEIDFEQDILEG